MQRPLGQTSWVEGAFRSEKLSCKGPWVRQVGLKAPLVQRSLVTKAFQTSWVEGAFGSEKLGYKGPWVRQVGLKGPLAQKSLVTKALGSDKLG